MESRYSPTEIEQKWYKFWEENGYFKADPNSDKLPFSILMPPPNLTGSLHLGHVMQHAIMDTVARFKRMQGFDVLLQPGVDHAGLQFQGTLDKKLSKEKINPKALSREEYLKYAWEFKDQNYASVSQTFRKTGISADWSREVFTLDEQVRQAVLHEFKTYYDQGLIYKGPYIVNWCSKCGTAIEDIETEYEERTESLYFINYKVVDEEVSGARDKGSDQKPEIRNLKPSYITVATVRPESIYADTGIAVHPNHPEYKNFVGKYALNPLTNEPLPIFEDDRVEVGFGTGALKVTPGHDVLDYEIGKAHHLGIRQVVGKDGRMTDEAQEFAGVKVAEAKKQVVDKLDELNVIAKIEEYTHQVPVCERCKTTVEPLISEEWFVKMKPLAEKAIQAIGKEEIKFLPENYNDILTKWLENIHDWTISRSQIWGHQIPVWYKGEQQQISLESPGEGWVQDTQVLDTWFSSGLWPMSTLGWPKDTKEFSRYYPWDLETSAPEIKFLWIARMIMIGLWFTEKAPFATQFFHGMLRDLKGQKFSKSLGNGIDPLRLFETWGVDATRMTVLSYSIPGRDGRVSNQTIDERAKNYRNFATKLWNIARFILSNQPEGEELNSEKKTTTNTHDDDVVILQKLELTTQKVTKHLETYELHLAAETLYEFIWNDFANTYLEQIKSRRIEAQPILEQVLDASLKLLHPFMPFVTEEINQQWSQLHSAREFTSLMVSPWPTTSEAGQ